MPCDNDPALHIQHRLVIRPPQPDAEQAVVERRRQSVQAQRDLFPEAVHIVQVVQSGPHLERSGPILDEKAAVKIVRPVGGRHIAGQHGPASLDTYRTVGEERAERRDRHVRKRRGGPPVSRRPELVVTARPEQGGSEDGKRFRKYPSRRLRKFGPPHAPGNPADERVEAAEHGQRLLRTDRSYRYPDRGRRRPPRREPHGPALPGIQDRRHETDRPATESAFCDIGPAPRPRHIRFLR